jgi:hypothetical protein
MQRKIFPAKVTQQPNEANVGLAVRLFVGHENVGSDTVCVGS